MNRKQENKINFKDYELDWRNTFDGYRAAYYNQPYMYLEGDEVNWMAENVAQYGWDDDTLIESFPGYKLSKSGLKKAREAGLLEDYLKKKFYAADKAHDNYRYLLPWPAIEDYAPFHHTAWDEDAWASDVAHLAFSELEDFLGGPNAVSDLFNDGRGGSLRIYTVEFSWNGIGGADMIVFENHNDDRGLKFEIKLDDDHGYYVAG